MTTPGNIQTIPTPAVAASGIPTNIADFATYSIPADTQVLTSNPIYMGEGSLIDINLGSLLDMVVRP